MALLRIVLCVIGFAPIGAVTGGMVQQVAMHHLGLATHLPPGNSRTFHLLGEFCIVGLVVGGLVGLGFGLWEWRTRK